MITGFTSAINSVSVLEILFFTIVTYSTLELVLAPFRAEPSNTNVSFSKNRELV